MQRGTPPNEFVDKANVHPYILMLRDPTDEELTQHFIIFGTELTIECPSLADAIFTLFAIHYVFDMNYHPRIMDFYRLCEERIMCIKCSTEKMSANYSSVSRGVSTFLLIQ